MDLNFDWRKLAFLQTDDSDAVHFHQEMEYKRTVTSFSIIRGYCTACGARAGVDHSCDESVKLITHEKA